MRVDAPPLKGPIIRGKSSAHLMRINSKFRDYYDYVEFLYSPEGGDPSNVYNRVPPSIDLVSGRHPQSSNLSIKDLRTTGDIPIFPQPIPGSFKPKKEIKDKFFCINKWSYFPWRYKWIFVCGRVYLLVSESYSYVNNYGVGEDDYGDIGKFRLLTEDHPSLDHVDKGTCWRRKLPYFNNSEGRPCDCLSKLSKELNCPVFAILSFYVEERYHGTGRNSYIINLFKDIPHLGQLGFASIVPAEQMYQNIAMYFNNLKDNPDNLPPVDVSDRDRLTQKGFDDKISFRGRAT